MGSHTISDGTELTWARTGLRDLRHCALTTCTNLWTLDARLLQSTKAASACVSALGLGPVAPDVTPASYLLYCILLGWRFPVISGLRIISCGSVSRWCS